MNQKSQSAVATASESIDLSPQKPRIIACLQTLIGDGLPLEYTAAPYKDPFSEEGLKSREAIWAEKSQPYCLIVQWEDSQDCTLNLRFWIVPKRPAFDHELRSDHLPNLFLHKLINNGAERLDFKMVEHNTQNGPLTVEMTQLLNRIESEQFLSTEINHEAPLCYLTCSVKTEIDFDTAVQQSYLLEHL